MNLRTYLRIKQAARGVTDLPIVDTVKMENIPDGSLGAALQKRVEANKKKLEMDRQAKLKTALTHLYNNRGLHLWN